MSTAAPQKSERPAGAGRIADKSIENTPILTADGAEGKALATLKAAYAMAGHAVHELADGGYLVCKFNLAKHCPDVRALAAFAKQTGVYSSGVRS